MCFSSWKKKKQRQPALSFESRLHWGILLKIFEKRAFFLKELQVPFDTTSFLATMLPTSRQMSSRNVFLQTKKRKKNSKKGGKWRWEERMFFEMYGCRQRTASYPVVQVPNFCTNRSAFVGDPSLSPPLIFTPRGAQKKFQTCVIPS